jgi:acyl-CoA reductase-like NAD-dependent aldehyde dehydrogenase
MLHHLSCVAPSDSRHSGINTANPTSAESPFGGIKSSGYGKEVGIGAGIEEYLITKTGALTLDLS